MTLWIDTPQALREHTSRLPPVIGLDTEFIRERTFWPQLALVQIALGPSDDGHGILLVDARAAGMCAELARLLANPDVLKLMHSPSEDLVAFRHACGALPAPLFDTQTAAALVDIGAGMSYQKLVRSLCGVELPKGETRSDWMRRPLLPSQLDYAADDVRYLHALHAVLQDRLDALGRGAWIVEECARQLDSAADSDADPWPHLGIRSARSLAVDGQHRLLRLLRWREAQARSSDRPRSWILDNELAVQLARRAPSSPAAFHALLDAAPKAPRSLREALWKALVTPLADEPQAPLAHDEERDRTRLRTLQDAVATIASELQLPESVLASRRMLEGLLDGKGWTGALAGWRRPRLEPRLAPLLAAAPEA
ncbi:MAG: ribonuclease D [Thermomonas sp.]|uniref:ribonuclease D n=1 Tax=Thermomonas sp. TaxID=1971895 RepID=UPI002624F53F|nr:ribonuclease D [Thermomonas sp.]MCC7096113.1 ribonuclease D [Thermomonas sp.]